MNAGRLSPCIAIVLIVVPLSIAQADPPSTGQGGSVAAAADAPEKPEQAGAEAKPSKPAATTASSDAPTSLDAGLRTFAGPCLIEPAGEAKEAALLGPALAGLLPQIASAGIDLLTNALDAAGQDKVTTVTAVLPLENVPHCIQIVRNMDVPVSHDIQGQSASQRSLKEALLSAPFLLEFYIRRSRDGSAISVMPTIIRYNQSIDGKKTGGHARELYATLQFTTVVSGETVDVSVPLGNYVPMRNGPAHYFDPVKGPVAPKLFFPTGAAASRWIKTPFAAPAGAKPPVQPETPLTPDARNSGRAQHRVGGRAGDRSVTAAAHGQSRRGPQPATTPHPQTPTRPANPFGDDVPPPADNPSSTSAGNAPPTDANPAPAGRFELGAEIQPLTIAVILRETRPGSALARAASAVLKGSKSSLVDVVDLKKERAAAAADNAQRKTDQLAYGTALGDYYKKRSAYCDGAADADALEAKGAAGADLLNSEVSLASAAQAIHRTDLPFTELVDPAHPNYDQQCR